MATVTHDVIVKRAEKWLKNKANCGAVVSECVSYTSSGEVPDCIGFRSGGVSILIECKTSRSDFLADRKKPFRKRPESGMGLYRFFMAPAGIIEPNELPKSWGLIELVGKSLRFKETKRPQGNMWGTHEDFMFSERNERGEWQIMFSALRRLQAI